MTQLEMQDVITHADGETREAVHRYMRKHRLLYLQFARHIKPKLRAPQQIWERFAFAILTANTEVSNAVRAFDRAREFHGLPTVLGLPGITRERMHYVNALPHSYDGLSVLLLQDGESWHDYRLRLADQVKGLAITKASYAVCLLYPTSADVACLDVWMQRFFNRVTAYGTLTLDEYVNMESQLRTYARAHHVCLALAQWMIWDWLRTGSPTSQRFFD